jgi:hypothetical protein
VKPPIVLSLYDRTGHMVEPWLQAGHECWIVDIQHEPGEHRDGNLVRVGADARTWLPPRRDYLAAFSMSPCTNLSVSGARWFKDKGIAGLAHGLELFERGHLICQWTEAPYMLEHPVSMIASYWRKADAIVHPWQFAGLLPDPEIENYTKQTCCWIGNGYRLPDPVPAPAPHRADIWRMAPSADRGDRRSATPKGFAKAHYLANAPPVSQRCVA